MHSPWPGEWILEWSVSQDSVGRSILGDLAEEYEIRRGRHGRGRAWVWYNLQALSVARHRILGLPSVGWAAFRRGESLQDFRFAWRALRAHPRVHALVVAVVATGVAGTDGGPGALRGVALCRAWSTLRFPAPERGSRGR